MTADRRDFLKTAAAGLTTSLFTGQVRGANDRMNFAFIGMGKMGRSNLSVAQGVASKRDDLAISAVCDIYERNLDWAARDGAANAAKFGTTVGASVRKVRDFREIIADKSVDAVCISTPDHWHAYMTVEACKAGKDVYVEKPICVAVEEGQVMVAAARKYNRVVQAGTMQRSAIHFQRAAEIVRSGALGTISMVHCWNYGNADRAGYGNPPDSEPPKGLDWDLWLGPAQARPFNANRFGVDPNDRYFSTFRWFWDYAGGMMTDWGVHWLDIVQFAMGEQMPVGIAGMGGKFYIKDNRDTPDTIHVSYEYPGFLATYENREGNGQSMFNKGGGILFCGDKATMFVDRSEYRVIPEKAAAGAALEPIEFMKSRGGGNTEHWQNFLSCIRSRQKPISDIETCQRSTTTCLLGNIAMQTKMRVGFDPGTWKASEPAAQKLFHREYRAPWKLEA